MTPVCARVVALTGRGKVRPNNQDGVLFDGWISQASRERAMTLATAWAPPLACAVADGMGGHPAGDLASRLALTQVAACGAGWTEPDALRAGLEKVNELLHSAGQRNPHTTGMGTTIAGLVLTAEHALCFNIGDSRVYQITGGYVEQLSTDDARLDAAGQPNGMLTQALGGSSPVVPHVTTVHLDSLDSPARFLLCTDGISGPIPASALRRLCREPDAPRLCDGLLAAAEEKGAPDNVSIMILDIVGAPDPVAAGCGGVTLVQRTEPPEREDGA